MGRWSPTVVAEAPQQPRSTLSYAMEAGTTMYDRLSQRRREREQLEHQRQQEEAAERRYSDERQYRMGRDQMSDQIGAMGTANDMIQHGAITEAPADEDPERLAGNTGPGGAESEAQPRWYMGERERIKNEAKQRYPGSGTIQQRDPRSGQTFYIPVRRQWEDEQMAALDARLAKERDAAVKTKTDRDKFDYETKIKFDNDEKLTRIRASLRPPPKSGLDDEDDDSDFRGEFSRLGQELDDTRSGITSANTRAQVADRAGELDVAKAAMQEARTRSERLTQLEKSQSELRTLGPTGYRQNKKITPAIDELAAQLPAIMNDKSIAPAEKAEIMKNYQAAVQQVIGHVRSAPKKGKPKSGLAAAMGTPY